MNTANIKKYAPKARNNFIAAVTKQAARYGITAKGTEPMEQRGDIALIGEKAFPKAIAPARKALERMVEQMGFAQAMEQAAYSWFNRLCAIRYMEIHDFLDHGRRVLSTANGDAGTPQILDDCLDISLPGLDPQQVAELKLDGNKDEELYRELLLAQCHALHEAMPFLFEAVDDATELLLPDNLTKTDSLIRELVSAIPEDDWQDVEIIGWLYQFYISEKKDQVIGKVVKSEDIPAATQLFTPNWIVQYLVQNSVGRQWLQTYPDSPLRNQMPYFIEPGEQPPEVQAQLDETLPDAIDPESIKVLDPACGSGHILVEAYKILKAIYEERGYRSRDIPQQILKHNLFGLDIDDRAGQLAGFALMMLAREDDRRLFSRVAEGDVTLNVLSLKETSHLDLPQLWQDLNLSGDWQQGSSQSLFESEQADLSSASADERYQLLQRTLERFEGAKTFGSLIEVPEEDAAPLRTLVDELEQLARTGDVMQKPAAETLLRYIQQAWILAQRYDSVIANPPYMGGKGMNARLKDFAKKSYPDSKSDLFAIFIERGFELLQPYGFNAMVTMQSWMFLSSYEKLRLKILKESSIECMVHMANMVMGIAFGTAATVCKKAGSPLTRGAYCFVEYEDIGDDDRPVQFPPLNERNLKAAKQNEMAE
ncbi:BREX-1 system adenine-specific DNA-methyltransferase PglX [Marinobacter segnicrescens]|uniref:BREX-1 system adenine-specific DNA-methyltransferase PglX n=1 Tax=Marinobacter segnicrescens TaxID=430453 RepID=UPI003A8E44E2